MARPTKKKGKGTLDAREETRRAKTVVEILRNDELNAKLPTGRNVTLRSTKEKYRVSLATLSGRVKLANNSPAVPAKRVGPPNVLPEEEDQCLVVVMLRRADRRHPHFKTDVEGMVEMLVDAMPEWRHEACLFTKNRPGRAWMKKFFGRHLEIRLGRAEKNEEIRFRHCNAKVPHDPHGNNYLTS